MMRHRVGGKQLLARCQCAHRCRSARALSTGVPGNLEPNGVVREVDAAATLRRRQHSSQQHPGGLGRVTDWGVPPRHSIAAYLHDSRDHEFPPRWLGASLPALASVRRKPLQPPPLPTPAMLTAVANLQAERAAAEAVVVDARRTLNDAWKSADSLHAQGVDQQDGGLLNAWWNKIKATSATQWHVADAGDDLLDAKEALAEVDGKVWRQLHLTKLPPTHYEQLINAGIWECLAASKPPLMLTERLFGAGPPPSLGSAERLAEFFDVDFLRRNELLVSWDQLMAYTAGCEQEADRLASMLDVDSKPTDHVEAMSRYQRCIEAWEVAGSGSVSVSSTIEEGAEGKKAAERAEALARVWSKYKKVAMGHYGQHLGMANAGAQSMMFDLRDMADAVSTLKEDTVGEDQRQ